MSSALLHQAVLQARGPADTRVQDAPEAAAAIVNLCGPAPGLAYRRHPVRRSGLSTESDAVLADLDDFTVEENLQG